MPEYSHPKAEEALRKFGEAIGRLGEQMERVVIALDEAVNPSDVDWQALYESNPEWPEEIDLEKQQI